MKKLSVILLTWCLAGCLGSYSPQSRFYYLPSVSENAVQVVSTKRLNIGVGSVELPDYLDRNQIVVFDALHPTMTITETERWGEPLETMIQRVIASDMSAYLPKSDIKIKSSLTERFPLIVEIEITKFDWIKDKQAVLEAWWYLKNGDGTVLSRQKVTETQSVTGDYADFVGVAGQMFGDLSRQIAEAALKY